jgi:serine/threonine protein kinase
MIKRKGTTGPLYAVKILLHKDQRNECGGYLPATTLREISLLRNLPPHPCVIRLHDLVTVDSFFVFSNLVNL